MVDLQTASGSPAVSGQVESWTDPHDGLTYAAATSSGGLVLSRRAADGTWSYRNLNEEILGAGLLVGDVTVFTSQDKAVHIAGLDAAGDVIAYWWTPGIQQQGKGWQIANLTAKVVGDDEPIGPVRGLARANPARIDILSPAQHGDLLRHWWEGDPWRMQNLSELV